MPQDLKVIAEQRAVLTKQLDNQYGVGAVVPITSIRNYDMIEHKPDVTMETNSYLAAKMIFKQTHRLASPEEHAKCRADRAERVINQEREEAERRMRDGKFAVLTDPRVSAGPSETELAMGRQLAAMQAEMTAMRSENKAAASVPDSTAFSVPPSPVGRNTKRDGV